MGHSFGAMMACEVAALRPARIRRLVLIDPIGLWRDEAPVINWMLLSPQVLPAHVFKDPDGAAAKALFTIPDDLEAAAQAKTRLTWAMGSTGKFIWPIPDKGLKKRIHRITAARAVDLGRGRSPGAASLRGRVRPTAAADDARGGEGRGHAPHLEQPEATSRVVQAFLSRPADQ